MNSASPHPDRVGCHQIRMSTSSGIMFLMYSLRRGVLYIRKERAREGKEQLSKAKYLQGTTMPDRRKYEDWLKDKEGSGKDGENE
jgi:hypothetical protein